MLARASAVLEQRYYTNSVVLGVYTYLHRGVVDGISGVPYPEHLGTLWLCEDRQRAFWGLEPSLHGTAQTG